MSLVDAWWIAPNRQHGVGDMNARSGPGRASGRPLDAPELERKVRRRMNAEDRDELILREATGYFAEQGLRAGAARRRRAAAPLQVLSHEEALIERRRTPSFLSSIPRIRFK